MELTLGSQPDYREDGRLGPIYVKNCDPTEPKQVLRAVRNIETTGFAALSENPVLSYRKRWMDEKGVKGGAVLYLWDKHGVATPDVEHKRSDELHISEVPGRTIEDCLREGNAQSVMPSLMDTVLDIRRVARQEDNNHLFHLDMKPDNFIYNSDDERTYAIDPGIEMKPNASTAAVDTGTHLQFMYHLDATTTTEDALGYAAHRLPRRLQHRMLESNTVSTATAAYYAARRNVMNTIRGESRQPLITQDRAERINDALEKV